MAMGSLPPTRWPWRGIGLDTVKFRIPIERQKAHLLATPSMPPGWEVSPAHERRTAGVVRHFWRIRHTGLDVLVEAQLEVGHEGLVHGRLDVELSVATLASAIHTPSIQLNLRPAPVELAAALVFTVIRHVIVDIVGLEIPDIFAIPVTRVDAFVDLWPLSPRSLLEIIAQHPPVVRSTPSRDSELHEDHEGANVVRMPNSITEYRNAFNTKMKGAKRGGCPTRWYDREVAVIAKLKRRFKDPSEREKWLERSNLAELLHGCIRFEAEHGREALKSCKAPAEGHKNGLKFGGADLTVGTLFDRKLWKAILSGRLAEKGFRRGTKIISASKGVDMVDMVMSTGARLNLGLRVAYLQEVGSIEARRRGLKLCDVRAQLAMHTKDLFLLDPKAGQSVEEDVVALLWRELDAGDALEVSAAKREHFKVNEQLITLLGEETPGTKRPRRRTSARSSAMDTFGFHDDGRPPKLEGSRDSVMRFVDGPTLEELGLE